ncbi:MAG TPA: CapA family protein [Bacteroidota bacterium]|nr:CapA family protein [Bacteroidota bacterium]
MRRLAILFIALTELCLGQNVDTASSVKIVAFGDVNLGRTVGQRLLKGDIDYPFEKMKDYLSAADVVFVNLESQLSEQDGETEDPTSNSIFCAPPVAAASLRRARIGVVSTANNHAFDYGFKGLKETISLLRSEGIQYAGTSADSTAVFPHVIIQERGIRIGLAAFTQFVNVKAPWEGYISLFDSQKAKIEIEDLKKKTDFVLASYHGGKEYIDVPDEKARADMRSLIDAGADIVLGHHPHVPLGIEEYNSRFIFHSLGNFVFYQSPYWSRRSFGAELHIEKLAGETKVTAIRLIPVRVGYQVSQDLSRDEVAKLIQRVKSLSNVQIETKGNMYFVQLSSFTSRE